MTGDDFLILQILKRSVLNFHDLKRKQLSNIKNHVEVIKMYSTEKHILQLESDLLRTEDG